MDDSENQDSALLQSEDSDGEGKENADDKKDPSDSLTPEHPRFKQVLSENKELKTRLEALEQRIETRVEKTGDEDLTDEEKASMAKIKRELTRDGFMTKGEWEQDQQVERVATTLEKLSDKYDGTNGFPEFVAEDMVAYAKRHGFGENFEAAYKQAHEDAYLEARAKQKAGLLKAPRSEKPTGTSERAISGSQLSEEEVANMSDAEYEKVREKIHQGLKQAVRGK